MVTYQPTVVQVNGLEFWTESFGDKKHPAILLIMGSGGQGILWPQEFCERLAAQGYFVIRYDHRDTGLSSAINYQENPYTLFDMAKDALGILDCYQIKKAHIIGASMGGTVSVIFAAHFPERVANLILLMSTSDLRPAFAAYMDIPTDSKLSEPLPEVVAIFKNMVTPPVTMAEKVASFLNSARANSGGKVPIDEVLCEQIALQIFMRTRNPDGTMNHFHAAQASHDVLATSLPKIKAPTLIIHGDTDPIFPIDHAYALKDAIKQAKLVILKNLGHGLSSTLFFQPLIGEIVENIRNLKLSLTGSGRP